jgi:hypothetical protein
MEDGSGGNTGKNIDRIIGRFTDSEFGEYHSTWSREDASYVYISRGNSECDCFLKDIF